MGHRQRRRRGGSVAQQMAVIIQILISSGITTNIGSKFIRQRPLRECATSKHDRGLMAIVGALGNKYGVVKEFRDDAEVLNRTSEVDLDLDRLKE